MDSPISYPWSEATSVGMKKTLKNLDVWKPSPVETSRYDPVREHGWTWPGAPERSEVDLRSWSTSRKNFGSIIDH